MSLNDLDKLINFALTVTVVALDGAMAPVVAVALKNNHEDVSEIG